MNKEHEQLVQALKKGGYLKSKRIVDAFEKVDRKDFVPEHRKDEAYANAPLPIGEGQTISQPLTVALMLEMLNPQVGNVILDVGAGSGWTATLLAELVGADGKVYAVERVESLAEFGKKNVAGYDFVKKDIVEFVYGDAVDEEFLFDLAENGFDRILSGAAAYRDVPAVWKEVLKEGGKIVAPVENSVIELVKKGDKEFEKREHYGFSFVPLLKGQK